MLGYHTLLGLGTQGKIKEIGNATFYVNVQRHTVTSFFSRFAFNEKNMRRQNLQGN